MGLATPAALLALVAIAVPIAAHFMRRRELPVVKLPTLALLEAARAKSRRKVRLVDRLLLISRIALFSLLALALAEPFVTTQLAFGDGRVASTAIIIDDSLSMLQEQDGDTLLQKASGRARSRIDALPPGSEVAVILAGEPARVLVSRTDQLGRARQDLRKVEETTSRGTDGPGAAILAERELLGARHQNRRIFVLTDGAAHGHFGDVVWPQDLALTVEPLGQEPGANVGILAAKAMPDLSHPGRVQVEVEIRAFGATSESIPVSLRHQEEVVARGSIRPEGGIGRTTLTAPFGQGDDPVATVELHHSDAIAADNRRDLLLEPSSGVRALLVNGDPHPARDRDEVGYLTRALDLGPRTHGSVTYRTIDPDALSSEPLSGWDVVVLANAPLLPRHEVDRLRDFVRGGGGLLVSAGDRVEPRAHAARFGDLLPASPRALAQHATPLGLSLSPIARVLDSDIGLAQAQVHKVMLLGAPSPSASVELLFEDDNPALVVGSYGAGRVALFATTLDSAWTDLPFRPGYLPLVTELLRHVSSRTGMSSEPFAPGTPVPLPTLPGARHLVIVGPDGVRHGHPVDDEDCRHTQNAGAYRVMARDARGALTEDPRAAFIVAPPIEESDLTPGKLPEGSEVEGEPQVEGMVVRQPLAPWVFACFAPLFLAEGILRLRKRR